MKNVKTRLKYDFGVGDLLLTKPASLPKDNSRISWHSIHSTSLYFLHYNGDMHFSAVGSPRLRLNASLVVLVFLMKKQNNMGSSTMHIISQDQSWLMQGNKKLLYDYITRLKLIRHKNIDFCLNSIKTDRVRT